ncbi:MAG: N-acetylmuramoyl-L-alanine amidase [Paludibacter sp.]|nr:N-acetylmuramoyl-L-alanine amidase [Paludibacter sp.]
MKRIIFFAFAILQFSFLQAQNLTGVRIYINPGHGGFDADDRNVVIAPFTSGNPNGFWESQSNLDKGLQLRTMLQNTGASVSISRTTNTTADDLPLSQIVTMANQFNSDFMLAIHSNAGNGVASYVLMIHYGSDLTDTQIYNTYNPNNPTQLALSNKSRDISTEIAKNTFANQITTWSSGYQVRGDKTFARTIMGFTDGYGVLRGLTVPGVISEVGMHDYIPETYRLMNMEYKWLEAWNFYKSFCNYFNGGQITTGVIAGQVRDSRIKLETSYNKFAGNDQMLPLNGAKLTLVETGETYTADNLQNGVFVFKNLTPGVYNVKAEKDGYYPQTKTLTVTAHNIAFSNFALNRVRSTPPQVLSFTPNVSLADSVEASTSISFSFNWDMDATSTTQAFSITPHTEGTFTWEDTNYRMRFTPNKPLEKNTVYTVNLANTASHPDNLSMLNDVTFQFRTKNRNRLSLITSYPFDGNNKVYFNNPTFRLVFDRKLNTGNLQTAIKVLDETNTVLAKTTRSVVNNSIVSPYGSTYFNLTQNLIAGKEYTLVVDGEVMDEVGMKLVEPINIKFKASNTLVTAQPVIETFETPALTYISTESLEITSATVATNTTKLFDFFSNKINVLFSNISGEALFGFLNPLNVSNDKVVGMHVFGDHTGNEVWLQFRIPDGVQYLKLCDLNFYGWEFHEVDLSNLSIVAGWTLTGMKIERKNRYLFSAVSDILLDNMLLYDELVLALKTISVSKLKAYPNPASSVVRVDVPVTSETLLELYSLNGELLSKVNNNKMNVTAFSTGTYILKLRTAKDQYTCPLIISR